ncbi:MAG: amino acid adenylation domain-containing protein [Burkholderiaceae bacterium]
MSGWTGAGQASLEYWRQRLVDLPTLALPSDRPRPTQRDGRAARVAFELPRALLAKVDLTARNVGATRFMVLLAAFQALLARYSGQTDIVVGTPVSGRTHPAFESVVGYFANMLVMRGDVSGSPDFRTLIERTRASTLDAMSHQEIPFERVVAALSPPRVAGMNPLFQVSFAVQNFPRATLEVAGSRCTVSDPREAVAQFDLSMTLVESGEGLRARIDYSCAMFDADRIERMAEHYVRLLEAALDAPERPVAEHDYLTVFECQRLQQWNDTERAYSRDQPITDLVKLAVQRSPQAVAIVEGERSLSYRELDAASSRLAGRLRSLGVVRGGMVALCLPRGIDALVAMLGTLKVGAAYLPLDPTQPPARLGVILEDAHPNVVVGTGASLAPLLHLGSVATLAIDADSAEIVAESDETPSPSVEASDLAYVIYTSGSTGTPKGVGVEHRSLCNHTEWLASQFGFDVRDRVLWRTTPTFDAAGVEIWPALCAGATLIVADDEAARDPGVLLALMVAQRVSRAQLVPGLLGALLEHWPQLSQTPRLRTLFVGGDVLSRADVERWQALTDVPLVNLYGPTECTIDATWHECTLPLAAGTVPIGRPVANARVYVLDAQLRPVPFGIDGEICIAGDLVARGYLGGADKEAERFIDDPFSLQPGARMYRSGDRGRWRADGTLECLGRIDRQLKLRGFRIEPGEIESACISAGARHAAVLAVTQENGSIRLACFVEPTTVDLLALQKRLAERVPDYMMPTQWAAIEQLPRLANGKIDRNALRALQSSPQVRSSEPPQTVTEVLVASAWCDVLGVASIGRNDDFFGLGGDSLSAARAAARIRARAAVHVPLRLFYEQSTLAALATAIDAQAAATVPGPESADASGPAAIVGVTGSAPSAPPRAGSIPAGGVTAPERARHRTVKATSSQLALWYVESLTQARSSFHIVQAWRLDGALNIDALGQALARLAARHEALRTDFVMRDETLMMRVHEAVEASLTRIEPDDIHSFGLTPFELGCAPLWRAAIARDPDGSHVFVLAMHHIVTDGWSMSILRSELSAAYASLRDGRMPEFEASPPSYLEHVSGLNECATNAADDASIAYWRERLADLAPLAMPTDRPRPVQRSYAGDIVELSVRGELLDALEVLARRHRASLYMVLLAAWQLVLARHSGSTDIAVGSPVAGRGAEALDAVVGYFANMLVMRADVSGNPSYAELLSRVRDSALDAFEHQDAAFDRLVAELRPAREPGANPLFQVSFALQNMPEAPLALAGVHCTPLARVAQQSKFDLTLSLTKKSGQLDGALEFACELFDRPRIERLAGHFLRVLEQVAVADDTGIEDLELIGRSERERIVCWGQAEGTPPPAELTLAHLFDQQVARTPDAIALVDGDHELSYAMLAERANRLANWLRDRGAQPGETVAIALARGESMLIAQLAVAKSGAAYLPLDPQFPVARLRAMLIDAAPLALIADTAFEEALFADAPSGRSAASRGELNLAVRFMVDREAAQIEALDPDPPAPMGSGADPAHLMYTSGSTGGPKGVLVSQTAVILRVRDTDYLSIGPSDRVAQLANVAWDVATMEIWGAWLNGARLVVLPRDTALSTSALRDFIRAESLTMLFLTTSLFNAHASADPTMFAPLSSLLFGGEAADPAVLKRMVDSGAVPPRLVNCYGPTETTIFASAWFVPRDPRQLAAATRLGVPIGRPVTNTRFEVLDAHGRHQPIGVVGELVIAGPGVGFGYLNRPELTAESFIADPNGPHGATRYRTGDLVRWREDGSLLFVGRRDAQVKIRGFRIEIGEIVAALRAAGGLRDAVAIVIEREQYGRQVVAFVCPEVGSDVSPRAIREDLREFLPDYMIPSEILLVDALPITANGKLDRAALVALLESSTADRTGAGDDPGHHPQDEQESPLDETGMRVLDIWRRVLDLPTLSADAHFFDAGGHSLLALKMLAEVEKEFDAVLRVAALFEAPTARRFAERIGAGRTAGSTSCAIRIQAGGRATPLYIVSGYGSELVAFRALAQQLGPDQPLVVLDPSALDQRELADLPMEEVASRMVADLRRVQPCGPYQLCGFSLGGRFVFEIARQLEREGESVHLLAMLDAPAPGYPRARPIPQRVVLHIRNLLRQSFAENVTYVRRRIDWFLHGRSLFVGAGALAESSAARAIAQSAEALFAKWRGYVPADSLKGSMLIVRATIRDHRPGIIDDDRLLGWGRFVAGAIEVRDFNGAHRDLRDPAFAPMVASVLSDYLGPPRDTGVASYDETQGDPGPGSVGKSLPVSKSRRRAIVHG